MSIRRFLCEPQAMTIQAEAIYENGVLRLDQPLPLEQGERVLIEVLPKVSLARQALGMVKWTGDSEALEKIAKDAEFGLHECP